VGVCAPPAIYIALPLVIRLQQTRTCEPGNFVREESGSYVMKYGRVWILWLGWRLELVSSSGLALN